MHMLWLYYENCVAGQCHHGMNFLVLHGVRWLKNYYIIPLMGPLSYMSLSLSEMTTYIDTYICMYITY